MTEQELRIKLRDYAECLLGVIEQSCYTKDDRIFHRFISAYENAFDLLDRDGFIIHEENKDDKLKWEKLDSFLE